MVVCGEIPSFLDLRLAKGKETFKNKQQVSFKVEQTLVSI